MPVASEFSLRKTVITSSAVVAVAGLSLTMVVPANAWTLQNGAQTAPISTSSPFVRNTQSYSVPVDAALASATRDGYTATPPQVLAARHAAAVAAREAAKAAALGAVVGKSAAIDAILSTPVTFVSYAKPAVDLSNETGDTPAIVTTKTSGTVSDYVSKSTLAAGSIVGDEIVATAVQYVGVVPYVHGGATPQGGFDCSGLVMYVYAKFGVAVPHDVDGIAALGSVIPAAKLQSGDLVVYPHKHIGIYIGDGYMVDAPDVGRDVEVQSVWGSPVYVRVPGA